jgi:superfamily II DNA/RNA helicase
MSLQGIHAFEAISNILAGKMPGGDVEIADIGPERLRRALADSNGSSLDLAVLIRQILLGEEERRGIGPKPRLPAPTWLERHAHDVGLDIDRGQVRAKEWRPQWVNQQSHDPALAAALPERRRFGATDEGPIADPFLWRLDRHHYRSVGQRAAVRSALLTPSGDTVAIDLPTGEGKSLVFQAIDEVGFASNAFLGGDGVTLVIVPTVALAYDHENACGKPSDVPLAYVGGRNEEDRVKIRSRIGQDHQGLVFAAPESACRSLRPALVAAAKAGRLKAIVVDEAHLVDAWGTGFRTDFQGLSGLRRELIEQAPKGLESRSILLSATLTPETLDTLRLLFSDPGEFRFVSAGQVRPEPDYWVAQPSTQEEQNARVVEALHHLPRPAILYVTEVAQAKAWARQLGHLGFKRMASFHGQTRDDVRKQTLDLWREGLLDLVVATSAFGLGIDYPHVRSVVHACVPETYDRFYQEVGRGGRDGCASVSMAIPSHRDFNIARRLNEETILSVDRGLDRWAAMFRHPDRVHLGGTRFRLRLDVAPGQSTDDIDLVGERSLQWNARLLTLLARSGLVRLGGAQEPEQRVTPSDEDEGEGQGFRGVFETVDILETDHLNESIWQRRVEPVRQRIRVARERNLDLMLQHLKGDQCPAELLVRLYGRESLDPICSECGKCRLDAVARKPSVLRHEPAPCWNAPALDERFAALFGSADLVVTYSVSQDSLSTRRRWSNAFRSIWSIGFRALDLIGEPPEVFKRALDELRDVPVFVAKTEGGMPPRLPMGPRALLIGEGQAISLAGPSHPTRLIIIPEDVEDADRPGDAALERFSGLVMDLDQFMARLN